MVLTWYGHSCFRLDNGETSVVFDPYSPGSVPGCTLPQLCADAVICSHGHGDHNYSAGVKLTGKAPSFALTQLETFHDEAGGTKRGRNTISKVELDGISVCHMGDLGHELSREQLDALGSIDVLLIPVGGFYTIDAKTAAKIVADISPRVVVPMHYRGGSFGYDVIGTVDDFTRFFGNVVHFDGPSLEINRETCKMTAVLAFTNCR